MRKLRYGIIGAGCQGCNHIENVNKLPAVEVAALADPHPPSMIHLPSSARDYFENQFASKPQFQRRHVSAPEKEGYPYRPHDQADLKRQMAHHFALITVIDEQIGRVLGHLRAAGNRKTGVPDFLDPKTPTVTGLLKKAGYATAHFGKWHLGRQKAPDPGAYGIDAHRTTTTTATAPTWENENAPEMKAPSTALIVDETIGFIKANKARPFYVNVWTRLPHSPLHPSEQQLEPYQHLRPDANLPYLAARQIYYASITDIDTQVGRLMAALEDMELTNNTLVIFSSDNGPEEMEVRNASYSYEGGVRAPFVVRWPQHVPAGRVDDTSVLSAVDFLPTVCKLAGAPLPKVVADGEDIGDVLRGKTRSRAKPLFWEWRFNILGPALNRSPMLALRAGEWKLLMNPDKSRVELYNVGKDPMEVDNQADRHPDVVDRLSKQLLSWRQSLPAGPVDPAAGRSVYPCGPRRLRRGRAARPLRAWRPSG